MDLCEKNCRKLLDFIKLHIMPGIYLHLCKTHTVRYDTYAISLIIKTRTSVLVVNIYLCNYWTLCIQASTDALLCAHLIRFLSPTRIQFWTWH